MFKKAVLTIFATMLLVACAGLASANQIDGMISGAVGTGTALATQALPSGLDISVNPGGLGDTLVYGYYNAREALTFIRVVNTSTVTAVKARVRFREAKRSKEILDFNICLSNKDQWTAWVVSPTINGPAVVLPVDSDTVTGPAFPAGGQPFTYSDTATITGYSDVTADDTKEGYFEIIGTVAKGVGSDTVDVTWTQSECINLQAGAAYVDVPNVLAGNAYVFAVRNDGAGMGAFSYNALAFADWHNTGVDYAIANETPTLGAGQDLLAGVDYVLTKTNHYALYTVEDWIKGETEVILTFPTKWLHVTSAASSTTYTWSKPFDTVDSNRCEPITLSRYDSEEDTTTTTTGFSPSGSRGPALCNEVNVIKINKSDILKTGVAATVDVSTVSTPTGLGWIRIGLDTDTINCTTGNSTCFGVNPAVQAFGLPSIGFVLNQYLGVLSGMDSTQYDTRFSDVTSIVP